MKVYFPLLNGPHWQGTTCFQLLNVSHLGGTCRVAAMPMEMALSPENKGSPGPACAGSCSWSPLCSGSNRDCAGNVVPCLGTWLCPLQSASACSFYKPGRHAAACSFFLVSVPRVLECSVAPLPQERWKGCKHCPSTWVLSSGSPSSSVHFPQFPGGFFSCNGVFQPQRPFIRLHLPKSRRGSLNARYLSEKIIILQHWTSTNRAESPFRPGTTLRPGQACCSSARMMTNTGCNVSDSRIWTTTWLKFTYSV